MNPLVFYFVNGTSFFVGLLLTAVTCGARLWRVMTRTTRILTAASVVGAFLVLMSGTALPIAVYSVWLVGLIVTLTILGRPNSSRPTIGVRRAVVVGFLFVCAATGLWEAQFQRSPQIAFSPGQTIYVIGDSISAGMRLQEKPWPVVLGEMSGLHVVNLAQAGATAKSALAQADGVKDPDALIIIEIGGNDLLGDTDSRAFRRDLDRLLAKLSVDNHHLAMFELPLPPLNNGYGWAQRDLARAYNVTLIPKRYMTRIIGMKGGTLDGLHLSQAGHDAMAAVVRGLISVR